MAQQSKRGFRVKRVYDEPDAADGTRVLVDRLWPRGISKDRAHIDEWAKEVAPSTELRRWFHADPDAREAEFHRKYRAELADQLHREQLAHLRELGTAGTVTLVTATKDPDHSQVPVLLAELRR